MLDLTFYCLLVLSVYGLSVSQHTSDHNYILMTGSFIVKYNAALLCSVVCTF